MTVRVSLDRYLKHHNITAYRLAQEARGRVAQGSVYALARGANVKRVDLETLGGVIEALERLIGERVDVADLLEREDAPLAPEPELEPALAAVLAAARPFRWDELKGLTDPEAEPFGPIREASRADERHAREAGQDRMARLGRLWDELDAPEDVSR